MVDTKLHFPMSSSRHNIRGPDGRFIANQINLSSCTEYETSESEPVFVQRSIQPFRIGNAHANDDVERFTQRQIVWVYPESVIAGIRDEIDELREKVRRLEQQD
jgi:hypothetical protein